MLKNDIERKNYKTLYDINFDFENSTKQWEKNKIKYQNSTYQYKDKRLNNWTKPVNNNEKKTKKQKKKK